MSDTSIAHSTSSKYENNYYRRKENCWKRIGANICVGILAFTTILLLLALIYVLYQQEQQVQQFRQMQTQKGGKQCKWLAPATGMFSDVFGFIHKQINQEGEASSDEND